MWLTTIEGDAGEDAVICLRPATPGLVFDRLVELLPLAEGVDA
jgi:hypothetical protein